MADPAVSVKFVADIGSLDTGLDQARASLQGFSTSASESLAGAGAAMDELGERHTMVLIRTFGELGRSVAEGGLSFNKLETAALHLSLMLGESGGIAAAAQVAGSAILGVLTNPVTLATIALVGATEAAGWFVKALSGDDAATMKADLEAYNAVIKEVEASWKGATETVKEFGKESDTALHFDVTEQIQRQTNDLNTALDKLKSELSFQAGGVLGGMLGMAGADWGPFQNIVDHIKSEAIPDLAALHDEIAKLAELQPANQAIQELAAQLLKMIAAAEQAETHIKTLQAVLNQAPVAHGQLGGQGSGEQTLSSPNDQPADKEAARAANEAVSAMLAEMQTKLQVDNIELDSEKTKIDAEVSIGKMGVNAKFAALEELADKKYALDRQELEAELSVGNLSVAQHQAIIDKLKVLDAQYAANKEALDEQEAEANKQAQEKQVTEAKDVANAILGVWNSQLTAVLQGTETWGQAFAKMLSDMLMKAIETFEQIMVEWAILEVVTGGAASGGNAMAALGSVAKGVLGFHADGAYNVPQTELAILHPGEMVLDSTSAGITRGMLDGSGSGLGGPTINISAPLNVQTLDTTGMTAVLARHATTIAAAVSQVMNRNPSLRPSY